MKKIITATASFLALSCVFAFAQKFNPKVEVENAYEGKIIQAAKLPVSMTVPDSLYKFGYTLDYSVFDNPYKGSYIFKPYKIEMTPDPAPSGARKLFVNIGAGYSLHPELDVVYSPSIKKYPLQLSVYDNFRGFLGNYATPVMNIGTVILPACYVFNEVDRVSPGFVLDNKIGADARYEFRKLALEFDGGYRIFGTNDDLTSHFMQMFENELRLLPLDPNRSDYFYGARLYVNAGKDIFSALTTGKHKMGINNMGFEARFGVPVTNSSKAIAETGIQTIVYSGAHEAAITRVWVTPQYSVSWKGGHAALGVKVSTLMGNDNGSNMGTGEAFAHESNLLYPAVSVKQYIIPGKLAIYAKADGGDYLNCYADNLRSNPFLNPNLVIPNFDSSSERVNARAGFEGSAWGKLRYDIHGGYALYDNWQVESAQVLQQASATAASGYDFYLTGYYNYCDYFMYYGDATIVWQSPRVDVDAHLLYRFVDLNDERNENFFIAPPAWQGEIKASYNWNRQAYAGVSVAAQSSRSGYFVVGTAPQLEQGWFHVKGFVDLGVFGSYAIKPSWTVWLKSGNLLGHCVQNYFLHPEHGPYVTLGMSFNL